MSEIALPRINSFAHVAQQAEVSPEEPIFVLTGSQLRKVITKAVQEALESPKDLRRIVLDQAREIGTMQKDMDSLAENQLIQLRLINDLRTKGAEPHQIDLDRAVKIKAIMSPRDYITFAELRGILGIDKMVLRAAIKCLLDTYPYEYAVKRGQDKRSRILIRLPMLR